ncbi:MAG: WecB/TagA/CpsF family glycosyltransferase [Elainella sp. C42_A2020_010]|nr:WecB/TagA/CpsF family glycosyltransferase [Elainella sp. C42_A2020_010]
MSLPIVRVIGCPVTALPLSAQLEVISSWAEERLSKIICVANVHMLMEAHWHLEMNSVLQNADIVVPDGMPLVWMMRFMGFKKQDRAAGLDILLGLCQTSTRNGTSVYFLGSHADVLSRIEAKLEHDFPSLKIAGIEPLPFRPLTSLEDEAVVQRINTSGAGIVFVALGCPKQEYWMAEHRHRIQAVLIGVGGAFPVYAGIHRRAPRWMREMGLEWFYRLIQEPQRLWKRYAATIPPFIYLALKQLLIEQWLHLTPHGQPQVEAVDDR